MLSRGLRVALLAVLLCGGVPSAQHPGLCRERGAAQSEIRISRHALARMAERGVSREQVSRILRVETPFQYYYRHGVETGYYDARSGIFVATADGVVITVIANATPRYIDKLKKAKPKR